MGPGVAQLVSLGRFPSEADIGDEDLERRSDLVREIEEPATEEEARALLALFSADDDELFGLAWSLVTLVESAPGWPYLDALDGENAWHARLRLRARHRSAAP